MEFVLRALSNGSDGVFIGGCRLNECNYITHGNFHALNMVLLCKKIMEHIGLDPKRLRIEFMSAGDGIRFAELMNDFGEEIKGLGPIGQGEKEGIAGDELKSKLDKIRKLVPYIKIAKKKKLELRFNTLEEYQGLYTDEEIDHLLNEIPSYYIDPDKCMACMMCARKCPAGAISGGKNKIHVIDQEKCIKCGTCFEACPPRFGAVQKIIGKSVPPPIAEDKRVLTKKSGKKKA